MKVCTKCKVEKPLHEFYKNQYWCKICQKQYQRSHYNASPKFRKIKANSFKHWYIKNCEKNKTHQRQWRTENKSYYNELMKKYIAKRMRKLAWIKLFENPFAKNVKIAWHHINDIYVVAIPEDLHKLYSGYSVETHRAMLDNTVQQIYNENEMVIE